MSWKGRGLGMTTHIDRHGFPSRRLLDIHDFWVIADKKARKRRVCWYCGSTIEVGETYTEIRAVTDGHWSVDWMCHKRSPSLEELKSNYEGWKAEDDALLAKHRAATRHATPEELPHLQQEHEQEAATLFAQWKSKEAALISTAAAKWLAEHPTDICGGDLEHLGKLTYQGKELTIWQTAYAPPGYPIAILLTSKNLEPYATVSTRLLNEPLEYDEFYVQPQGIEDALLSTGLFEDTGKRSASGLPCWRLKPWRK